MPLKTSDIEFKAKLPRAARVAAGVRARRRRRSQDGGPRAERELGDLLRLGDLRTVELEHGIVMAGERGDIILPRERRRAGPGTQPRCRAKNELRKWDGLQESQDRRHPDDARAARRRSA